MAAPVCTTCSGARRADDGGPRPLRLRQDLYGLKSASPPFSAQERDQLKLGILETFLLAEAMLKRG
eukprot:3151877-Amphidinium_carterae.1